MPPEVTNAAVQVTPPAAAGAPAQTPPPAEVAKTAPVQTEVKTAEPVKAAAVETKTTVLTEPLKTEVGKEKTEAKPEETKPPSEQKTVVPEKYDLKPPKDSPLSVAHLEKLSSYAKEKGLSNEQAQTLLERESQAVSDFTADLKESQSKLTQTWFDQAKNDKEIGGEAFKQNAELAKRVVGRFGTDEFKKELSKTGLGNHPELLRVFSRIGKAMSEDQLVIPGVQAGGKKSIESLLYGDAETKET